jgi:DNA-binding Lrp family transcriptional regulator
MNERLVREEAAPSRREPFTIMPVAIIRHPGLSPTDKAVLWVIASYDWEGGEGCIASYSTLAREAGVSESSLKRAIRKLHAEGYLHAPVPRWRSGERIGTVLTVTARVRPDRKVAAVAPAAAPYQLPLGGSTVNPPQEKKSSTGFAKRQHPEVERVPLNESDAERLTDLESWGCADPQDWLGMLLGLIAQRESEIGGMPTPERLRAVYDGATHSRDLQRKDVRNRVGFLLRGIEQRFLLARPRYHAYDELAPGAREMLDVYIERVARGEHISERTLTDFGVSLRDVYARVSQVRAQRAAQGSSSDAEGDWLSERYAQLSDTQRERVERAVRERAPWLRAISPAHPLVRKVLQDVMSEMRL